MRILIAGTTLGFLAVAAFGCGSIDPLMPPGGTGGTQNGNGGHATGSGGHATGSGGHATGTGGAGVGGDAGGGGCVCPAVYSPVCGVDGKTYGNGCEAQCAGVAIAHQGACAAVDAGPPDAGGPRRFCNSDSDCVFKRNDGCCGSCLAASDVPIGPPGVCTGACVAPPGGCSCVNHQCAAGILKVGAGCNLQQDACGLGLRCCVPCSGVQPIDGGPACGAPVCTPGVPASGSGFVCPIPF